MHAAPASDADGDVASRWLLPATSEPRVRAGFSVAFRPVDRVILAACALGGMISLFAVAVVVDRAQVVQVVDRITAAQLIALLAVLTALFALSLLTLRRMAQSVLEPVEDDRRRLGALLSASNSLIDAESAYEIDEVAARAALDITRGEASYVFTRDEHEPLRVAARAGFDADPVLAQVEEPLRELANIVMADLSPAVFAARADAPSDRYAVSAAIVVPITGAMGAIGVLAALHRRAGEKFDSTQVESLAGLSRLVSIAHRNIALRDAQRISFTHVADILVTALDRHLGYLEGHGERVARYASQVGQEIGLAEDRLQTLDVAALLHDIGMLKIDRTIPHDAKVCRQHALLGCRMLGRIKIWRNVAKIVLHHHEWYDGSGYPAGLAGDAIPIESRIVSVCDALDAMTASSSYSIILSLQSALNELESGAGTQFDPEVVRAVRRLVDVGSLSADGRH